MINCAKCNDYLCRCSYGSPRVDAGKKDDAGKPRWDLLPFAALGTVVDVLTYGAKKYSPGNWRHVEQPRARYFAASVRHLTRWWDGEQLDPETNLHHLAHAVCCLLFLIALDGEQP